MLRTGQLKREERPMFYKTKLALLGLVALAATAPYSASARSSVTLSIGSGDYYSGYGYDRYPDYSDRYYSGYRYHDSRSAWIARQRWIERQRREARHRHWQQGRRWNDRYEDHHDDYDRCENNDRYDQDDRYDPRRR